MRSSPTGPVSGMTDILLTHSYFLKFDPKEYRAMTPYPPLGTLYAAACLRAKGYRCSLFDSMLADSEEELRTRIRQLKPSVVVIYDDDFNYLTKMCLGRMREAAFRMSAMARDVGIPVIIHGSDPADHAADYLVHGANAVVVGEGEVTLGETVDAMLASRDLSGIHGLVYRQDGMLRRNPRRPVLSALDTLPTPAWDLVDVERYRGLWLKHHGFFSMNIVTTRGCPYHCNWCAKPIYGQVYHSRSPEQVVAEMLTLRDSYHPDHLWFCDDIFGLNPGWISRFADSAARENLRIPYKCLSRPDLLLRDDTTGHLARSGCETVWIGAESGSQHVLDAMEKGTTVDQIRQATSLLHRHGIRVGFFLQYGYPGEEREDIEKTLGLVRESDPDEIGVSVSYPLPGTKFYERVRKELGRKQNWVDSQDLDLMFQGTFVPDFYRVLHRVTHKKFRIWKGRRALRNVSFHPGALSAKSLRSILAMAYHTITLPHLESRMRQLELISPKR